MHLITTSNGCSFNAEGGESLLDAALRQGVVLNHSCRTGRCSSCKGRLKAGLTQATHEELGLAHDERTQGWLLTCVRAACGDVDLDIDDLGDVVMPEAKTLPYRIQSLERLSPDVLLRLPPTSALNFLPGQYIDRCRRPSPQLLHRQRPARGQAHRIARAPGAGRRDEPLLVRAGKSQRSAAFAWAAGHLLPAQSGGHGPVAAGHRHRHRAGQGDPRGPGTSKRERATAVDHLVLERSASRRSLWQAPPQSGMRFVPVLSRAGPHWSGARGHVQDVMLEASPDLGSTLVYACGSDAMIHSAQARLEGLGLPSGHFHSDAFVCSAAT